MAALISSLEVPPFWGLVSIRDFGTDDYPQTEDGDYDCLAGRGQIYVSTRPDSDGVVTVRVYLGDADCAGMRIIYDGVMTFESGIVSITPPAMDDEETIVLPGDGDWRTKLAVSGENGVDLVCVYLSRVV